MCTPPMLLTVIGVWNYAEGLRWLERLQSRSQSADPRLQARLLNREGTLATGSGDFRRGEAAFEASLKLASTSEIWRLLHSICCSSGTSLNIGATSRVDASCASSHAKSRDWRLAQAGIEPALVGLGRFCARRPGAARVPSADPASRGATTSQPQYNQPAVQVLGSLPEVM